MDPYCQGFGRVNQLMGAANAAEIRDFHTINRALANAFGWHLEQSPDSQVPPLGLKLLQKFSYGGRKKYLSPADKRRILGYAA